VPLDSLDDGFLSVQSFCRCRGENKGARIPMREKLGDDARNVATSISLTRAG